jgi:hypothetical protein
MVVARLVGLPRSAFGIARLRFVASFTRPLPALIQSAPEHLIGLALIPYVDNRIIEILIQNQLRLQKQISCKRNSLAHRQIAIEIVFRFIQRVAL